MNEPEHAAEARELIEAAHTGDIATVQRCLGAGISASATDEHGWTALSWAAGGGHVEVLKVLVDAGGDVFQKGRDGRTPYTIAIAASRREAAQYLQTIEAEKGGDVEGGSSRQAEKRKYCRAYLLQKLRAYGGWSEPADGAPSLTEETVVFLHGNFVVTRGVWESEDVIFSEEDDKWREFCQRQLGFRVPSDLDWMDEAPVKP